MRWLIDEMSFPYEDDSGFYEIVVKSNRIDIIEYFEIDIKDYAEELGKEGTEEVIDYAVSKKCDLSALLCDVALHQRKEFLEKLLDKYQKKVSVLNKLAIYTCLMDLEKVKSLVRNPNRLTGKELDVVLYSLGGINEYCEEFKLLIEWFLQFRPTLDQLIDPVEPDDEEEDNDDEGFGYDGIIYNLVSAGNAELLVKTLEVVSNDLRFMEVLPAICAKIVQERDLDMLKAVFTRFPKVSGEKLMQHFVFLLREEWTENVDVSYEVLLHGKRILEKEKEKLRAQFKCLDYVFDTLKVSTFADINCSNPNVFADFLSWSDVGSVKWLVKRGFSLDLINGGFLYSLQLNLFWNEVAKFLMEESFSSKSPSEWEWLLYLSLLRCDSDLLDFLATKLDLRSLMKNHPAFLSQFLRYVRHDGGLFVPDLLVPKPPEDGVFSMYTLSPIQVEGELLDDDYRPLRVIEYVQKLIVDFGAQWDEACTSELENYQGFLRDELLKIKAASQLH